MLGINPISDPAEGYYLDAVAQGVDEYYRGVGEAPGWWAGTAAAVELGLDGEVGSDDLVAVWSGLDPRSGEQLGPFTNRKVRGFDLCWRAPKSVSLLFAFGSPEVSKVVRDAHDRAVAAAFGYLESNAAATRKGHGGLQSEPVDGFVASVFRHRTSRTGDPHIHTHVLIANLAKAADGKWRTLDGRLNYTHHKTAGHLYQAHLRHELPGSSASSGDPSRTARPTSRASTGPSSRASPSGAVRFSSTWTAPASAPPAPPRSPPSRPAPTSPPPPKGPSETCGKPRQPRSASTPPVSAT